MATVSRTSPRMTPMPMSMPTRMTMSPPLHVEVTPFVIIAHISTVAIRRQGRKSKEDNVHDSKRPTGLEHPTGLIGLPSEIRHGDMIGGVPDGTRGRIDTVGVGNAPELVDSGDEGSHEGEVDEGDKLGICGGAVVAEEGGDGPCDGEDNDNEEDENRVGGEGVVNDEDVDEPGEHAQGGDLDIWWLDLIEEQMVVLSLFCCLFSFWCCGRERIRRTNVTI